MTSSTESLYARVKESKFKDRLNRNLELTRTFIRSSPIEYF